MPDAWITSFRMPGERIEHVWVHGGHLLGLVGGVVTAPFEPEGPVPPCRAEPPDWPAPGAVVSEGRFVDDEWVYDLALAGRVIANDHEKLAVRVAEHLVAGRGRAVLCVTDRRIAVIVQQRWVGEKSLLSRFRKSEDDNPVVWWEASGDVVRDLPEVSYGRHLEQPRKFRAAVFTDGSVLELARGGDW